jgi:hypothetical protein
VTGISTLILIHSVVDSGRIAANLQGKDSALGLGKSVMKNDKEAQDQISERCEIQLRILSLLLKRLR